MANARPLLKANTGVLESDLTSKIPGCSPVVPAKVWSGATIGRESDRLPWVVAALGVSKTGGGPHANINANNAVMIRPAVVPRISHSLNLGARYTFRINRSLHLNFCILQPPGRSLNFNLGKANLKFKPGVREIGGLDSKTPRDSTSTPRNGGGGPSVPATGHSSRHSRNPETDLFPSICLYNEMLPGLPFRGRAVMTRAGDHDAWSPAHWMPNVVRCYTASTNVYRTWSYWTPRQ